MTYLDTDVLVHAYVIQDESKHRQAIEIIERESRESGAVISTLSVQEMLFVLDRLGVGDREVFAAYEGLMQLQPVAYDRDNLRRGVEIAREAGFRNINDCIHTAIAETHCTELVTYNRQDFGRIRELTPIRVTIL